MSRFDSNQSVGGQGLLFNLKQYGQSHFIRWVSKRNKSSDHYQLHRKNLYIFPTLTGGAFLILSVVVWLLGTNYQNNLILALAYFQMSMFVIIILNTYNNLSGVTISIGSVQSVCVGTDIDFSFTVQGANRIGTHYVNVCWRNSTTNCLFDFDTEDSHKIHVPCKSLSRGYFSPEFLLVESTFPMGLLRCWTWLRFESKVLVYPAPIACSLPNKREGSTGEDEGDTQMLTEGDDFLGFTRYRPGDSTKHIAWSFYAKGQGLYRKQYGASKTTHVGLHWNDFFSGNTELCLSQLCYWARLLHLQSRRFSVSLPTMLIPADQGDEHLEKVMKALALFDGSA